jgi:hypothetical protein
MKSAKEMVMQIMKNERGLPMPPMEHREEEEPSEVAIERAIERAKPPTYPSSEEMSEELRHRQRELRDERGPPHDEDDISPEENGPNSSLTQTQRDIRLGEPMTLGGQLKKSLKNIMWQQGY